MIDAAGLSRAADALTAWYEAHRRDLPWRRTSDPYAIWVAEVMLQQTQVRTVVGYWQPFLDRFPTPAALARASEEQVLAAWSGLGYYRRARALHAGARAVVLRHGGRLPRDPRLLRELPGVGRYTAGAIASIAFGLGEPVLDGNVRRVLSRLLALDARRVGTANADRRLWEVAGKLARLAEPGTLNQALMELGALVCTPRDPACARCPLRAPCRARRRGNPETYPPPRARRPSQTEEVAVAWIARRGRLLLERPAPDAPLRGTWDLPAVRVAPAGQARETLARALRARHGLGVAVGAELARASHTILYRRLRLTVFSCRPLAGPCRTPLRRWIAPAGLDSVAVSGATRKVIRACRPAAVGAAPPGR